jgi:diphthamide synthase subunit DPH2
VNEKQVVRCEHGPDVTLREYIERIFDERQKALDIAFRASEQALALASRNLELRLEKLNELRQEVTQDRGEYVKREVFEARRSQLEKFQARTLAVAAVLIVFLPILTAIVTRNFFAG